MPDKEEKRVTLKKVPKKATPPKKTTKKSVAVSKPKTPPKKKAVAKSEPQPPAQVAIRRKQTIPGLVSLNNGKQYHFSVQHNICLAYVDAEDVPAILAFKKNCCNNSGSSLFKEANDGEIRVHTHGGRI